MNSNCKYFSFIKSFYHVAGYFLPVLLFLILNSPGVRAQKISVNATPDTNAILIGGQYTLSLEATYKPDVKLQWPVLADTFSFMEVISRSAIDTVMSKSDNSVSLKQKIVLTSFDSGFHVIAPVKFNYQSQGDTGIQFSETRPVLITVQSIPVDTTKSIKDIKGQMIVPYTWQDALPYIFGALIVALIIWLVYRFLKNRKSKPAIPKIIEPLRPAHEIALEQLIALDESKLWQQGNVKGYYTALADIIRTFIENRWKIAAMEMTTDEILNISFIKNLPLTQFEELKYVLIIADLAKFAKMTPGVYENEQCMKNAVNFVKSNIAVSNEREVEA